MLGLETSAVWSSELWQRVAYHSNHVCGKIYTHLVIFSLFRSFSVRKSACVNVVGSVRIISCLDSQSKFQMFTLLSSHHGGRAQSSTSQLHTELCKFAQNISTNIWSLGKHRDLKLGQVPSLPIYHNITISWHYSLNHFWFIFSLGENDLLGDLPFHIIAINLRQGEKFKQNQTNNIPQ